ncbi:hypothetical protein CCR75_009535 [Bremia lactucae]|uniref:Uncharacterized protein n=1 Tax=Bremia lactucae TaxID=4779 RepID=A0A976IGD5_BRELC|nr:hypothetical protein CCR75_009535 [Bremia lactucae]
MGLLAPASKRVYENALADSPIAPQVVLKVTSHAFQQTIGTAQHNAQRLVVAHRFYPISVSLQIKSERIILRVT